MKLKRKIVKRTHKNGSNTYVVKYRIWPFWFTDSWDYWYGPGICKILAIFNTLEQAQEYIARCEKEAEEIAGERVIRNETLK